MSGIVISVKYIGWLKSIIAVMPQSQCVAELVRDGVCYNR